MDVLQDGVVENHEKRIQQAEILPPHTQIKTKPCQEQRTDVLQQNAQQSQHSVRHGLFCSQLR